MTVSRFKKVFLETEDGERAVQGGGTACQPIETTGSGFHAFKLFQRFQIVV